MREPKSMAICRQRGRYTLTYNEGTAARSGRNCCRPIHPHIQWGNLYDSRVAISVFDIPSHTVREQAETDTLQRKWRYTLTYSEGTRLCRLFNQQRMIYSHIQWWNVNLCKPVLLSHDTPSHTVRELCRYIYAHLAGRYTLTYSEGTPAKRRGCVTRPIYPHIQWGNAIQTIRPLSFFDIPSHTVREPPFQSVAPADLRYTLTYSEGTWSCSRSIKSKTIYPHIQWGNPSGNTVGCTIRDIPSHTVRERELDKEFYHATRYTLTYSEGTDMNVYQHMNAPIYPHIQWGNEMICPKWRSWNDIPSHTVRELLNPECLASGKRYTLTYSEGTRAGVSGMELDAIYPHIQWGNSCALWVRFRACDIPSHTVRERAEPL